MQAARRLATWAVPLALLTSPPARGQGPRPGPPPAVIAPLPQDATATRLAYSADGRTLAALVQHFEPAAAAPRAAAGAAPAAALVTEVWLCDGGQGGAVRKFRPAGMTVTDVAFGADGRAVAVGIEGNGKPGAEGRVSLRLWEPEGGGAPRPLDPQESRTVGAVALGPRASRVFAARDLGVEWLDPRGGAPVTLRPRPTAPPTPEAPQEEVVFTAAGDDGRLAAWVGVVWNFDAVYPGAMRTATHAHLFDLRAGRERFDVPLAYSFGGGVALRPGGRDLAVSAQERQGPSGRLLVFDLGRGELRLLVPLSGRAVGPVAYSPDGSRLAVAVDGVDAPDVEVVDADTGARVAELRANGPQGGATTLAFRPDGRRIAAAVGSGPLVAWDLDPAAPAPPGAPAPPPFDDARRLAWHREQLESCEALEYWPGAFWHADRLVRAATPPDPPALARRAHALRQLGRWDDAARDARAAAAAGLHHWELEFDLGLVLVTLGDLPAALEAFEAARKAWPENGYAWFGRAGAHFRMGKDRECVADATEAIRRGVSEPEVWTLRADARLRLGEAAEALKELDDYSRRGGGAPAVAVSRCQVLASLGRWAEAADAARAAGDARTPGSLASGLLGECLARLGRLVEAEAALAAATAAEPNDFTSWKMLALVRARRGNAAGAREALARADAMVNAEGPAAEVAEAWGYLAALAGTDIPERRAACRRTLARVDPNDPAAASAAVWACVQTPGAFDDWGPVVDLARKAAGAKGAGYAEARALGAALARAGRDAEALAALDRAAGLQRQAPSVWLFRALVLRRLGREADAAAELARAREVAERVEAAKPGHADAATPWTVALGLRLLLDEARRAAGGR